MTKPLSSLAVLATAATLALTGCIKTDAKSTVAKDGTGTATQKLEIDMSQMKQMMEMFGSMAGGEAGMDGAAMGDPMGGEDPAASMKELEAKIKKVEGLTLKDFKTESKDGKVTTTFTVEFKEWSLLGHTGAFSGTTELVKNADGSYTFSMDPKSQMGGGEAGMDPAAMAPMLEPFLGSMEIATSITLPGAITETNGTKSEDGMTVSWKMGFKDLIGGKAGPQKVTFKGEGLELKPFKYTPSADEMKEMMSPKKPEKPAGDPK